MHLWGPLYYYYPQKSLYKYVTGEMTYIAPTVWLELWPPTYNWLFGPILYTGVVEDVFHNMISCQVYEIILTYRLGLNLW